VILVAIAFSQYLENLGFMQQLVISCQEAPVQGVQKSDHSFFLSRSLDHLEDRVENGEEILS